ncbi:MAG TPA: VOC family protein [Ilumatobacteraceae bacterium]|nr:VOC family protein [Ilumatobacteraceae bacterium]HRB02340.1 VOC family protein [Ilumatobacteraceae bacterium]
MDYTSISPEQFSELEGLDDWRFVLGAIHANFHAGSFGAAAALATKIAAVADVLVHHPDIDIRYPDRVHVMLTTHATGGLTTLDQDLARVISAAAADAGATSEPVAAQAVEIAIDTLDADRIRPFWAAVLGYPDKGGTLVDPLRLGPPVWFQTMDVPREERQKFHIDVSVAHDIAEQRVAAALAAGGTLVTEAFAKSWWVLADADGNEACICTWQDR